MRRYHTLPLFAGIVTALMFGMALAARRASGQSLLERSPNLTGGWVGPAGTLHFNFVHRFTSSDAPARKVNSSPTFLVAAGLPRRALVGFNYATNSDVAARYPNEWEFFGRVAPLAQDRGRFADVALQGGYNLAAGSVDGELTLGRRVGAVTVRAAARVLSDAFDLGESRAVFAGGGVLRLGSYVAVAGDYASMMDRPEGYDNAWSAALQVAIPYTPHTVSLQATNANTATLQGSSASRGGLRRYGFEFTIPVTLSRYVRRGAGPSSPQTLPAAVTAAVPQAVPEPVTPDSTPMRHDPAPAPASLDTVRAAPIPEPRLPDQAPTVTVRTEMRAIKFSPARIEITAGGTVVWTNGDPVPHTVTADDAGWRSGLIQPGGSFRRRFDRPGTYSFHCDPHPFMKGVVVVR